MPKYQVIADLVFKSVTVSTNYGAKEEVEKDFKEMLTEILDENGCCDYEITQVHAEEVK